MKSEFALSLDARLSRPAIRLENGLSALVDTGAEIPVCTLSANVLKSAYDARLVMENVFIGGFGGRHYGDIYAINLFKIGKLIYPNIHMFVARFNLGFHFILSSSMFHGLIYEIDTKNHALTVRIPDDESEVRNLRIVREDGGLYVMAGEGENGE